VSHKEDSTPISELPSSELVAMLIHNARQYAVGLEYGNSNQLADLLRTLCAVVEDLGSQFSPVLSDVERLEDELEEAKALLECSEAWTDPRFYLWLQDQLTIEEAGVPPVRTGKAHSVLFGAFHSSRVTIHALWEAVARLQETAGLCAESELWEEIVQVGVQFAGDRECWDVARDWWNDREPWEPLTVEGVRAVWAEHLACSSSPSKPAALNNHRASAQLSRSSALPLTPTLKLGRDDEH
jgi:hypothetical protein